MSVEFKLPDVKEALQRLDLLLCDAFSGDHPAMQDWVAVRFALQEASRGYVNGSPWISVKDRLPPEMEEVLLDHIIDDHQHTTDIAWQKGGEWTFPWIGRLSKEQCAPVWPVSWMPLPTRHSD